MTRAALAPMLLLCGLGACGQPDVTTYPGTEQVAKGEPQAISEAVTALADPKRANKDLLHALGRAMQVAPERVLPLVGTTGLLTAQAICLPQPWNETPQSWKATIEASRKAIESVSDPALAKPREACLAEVNAAATALDRGEGQ